MLLLQQFWSCSISTGKEVPALPCTFLSSSVCPSISLEMFELSLENRYFLNFQLPFLLDLWEEGVFTKSKTNSVPEVWTLILSRMVVGFEYDLGRVASFYHCFRTTFTLGRGFAPWTHQREATDTPTPRIDIPKSLPRHSMYGYVWYIYLNLVWFFNGTSIYV